MTTIMLKIKANIILTNNFSQEFFFLSKNIGYYWRWRCFMLNLHVKNKSVRLTHIFVYVIQFGYGHITHIQIWNEYKLLLTSIVAVGSVIFMWTLRVYEQFVCEHFVNVRTWTKQWLNVNNEKIIWHPNAMFYLKHDENVYPK